MSVCALVSALHASIKAGTVRQAILYEDSNRDQCSFTICHNLATEISPVLPYAVMAYCKTRLAFSYRDQPSFTICHNSASEISPVLQYAKLWHIVKLGWPLWLRLMRYGALLIFV